MKSYWLWIFWVLGIVFLLWIFVPQEDDFERVVFLLDEVSADGFEVNDLDALEVFYLEGEGLEDLSDEVVFAMNGGIFDVEYRPLGLFVDDYEEFFPLNLEDGEGNFFMKPNGVFYVEGNEAFIEESEEYVGEGDVRLAIQSGPMLIEDGVINGLFDWNSENRNVRNGVGVCGDKVLFLISNGEVTFYEFASLFEFAGCSDALYLDGAISEFYKGGEGDGQKFSTAVGVR